MYTLSADRGVNYVDIFWNNPIYFSTLNLFAVLKNLPIFPPLL